MIVLPSIRFNGIKKKWFVTKRGRTKSLFAPIERKILEVPGMDGAHLLSSKTGVLKISQPFGISLDHEEYYLRIKDELVDWLVTEEPVSLEFDDEPGRTYYALIQNEISDFEKFFTLGQGTLEFVCLDSFSYGPEKTPMFPSDAVTITNAGTAEADPIFTMQVKEPTTFAMVSNGEEYMMVGKPYDVTNQKPFKKYERIFYSDASSLVGWTAAEHVDGGSVSGTMETNGTRFQAANYGTGTSWHGPAIKTSLPEVLTDFRLEGFVSFFNKNIAAYVGRIEIYLLDVLGNTVGKIAIKDTQSGQALTIGEVRAGDTDNNHFLINEYGDRPGNWNNFNGHLRIEREGNRWYAYIAMVDTATGQHYTRRSVIWTDTANRYTRTVAQVAVHIGQFGNHRTPAGGVYSIQVHKINQEPDGIPYIALEGDEIEFDHVTGDCYINGEPVPFDFGGEFFRLNKGANSLTVLPENTFDTSIKYREKYR